MKSVNRSWLWSGFKPVIVLLFNRLCEKVSQYQCLMKHDPYFGISLYIMSRSFWSKFEMECDSEYFCIDILIWAKEKRHQWKIALYKICQNKCFPWCVFYRIRRSCRFCPCTGKNGSSKKITIVYFIQGRHIPRNSPTN